MVSTDFNGEPILILTQEDAEALKRQLCLQELSSEAAMVYKKISSFLEYYDVPKI